MLIAALLLQLCSASSVPPIVLHNQKIFLGSYDILGPFVCGMDEVEGFAFDNATALSRSSTAPITPTALGISEWWIRRRVADGAERHRRLRAHII